MVSTETESLLDEVNKLAESAGVRQVKGLIQSISYSNEWMKEDYKLLELSNDLVSVLNEGDTLTIRGHTEDEAVMCSSNKTFEIKAADTSNSLLLLPNLTTPDNRDAFQGEKTVSNVPVLSCFSTYYEVRHSRPNLQRLLELLSASAYSDSSSVPEDDLYSTERLLSVIQCSEEELREGLQRFCALQIDGSWRILEINYQEKAFSQILALLEEKYWDWKSVPFLETCAMLGELYPEFVLKHCFRTYGTESITSTGVLEGTTETETKRIFSLDEDKVCRYYAEYILRTAQGKFNFHEFMTAWRESVPEGMTVLDKHLRGVSLVNLKNQPPVIWHFPERNLPFNPAERFSVLFKARAKWTEEDIEPYIVNLLGPNQKTSALFLKYTRTSKNDSGQKVYSSK